MHKQACLKTAISKTKTFILKTELYKYCIENLRSAWDEDGEAFQFSTHLWITINCERNEPDTKMLQCGNTSFSHLRGPGMNSAQKTKIRICFRTFSTGTPLPNVTKIKYVLPEREYLDMTFYFVFPSS